MDLTQQQIKDKLTFLEIDDSVTIRSQNSEIKLEVTQEFTSNQKNIIKGYIDELYESPTAKEIFNQIKEPISIFPFSEGFFGQKAPDSVVFFDIEALKEKRKYGYISKTGEYIEYDLKLAFMHELIHAIAGTADGIIDEIPGNDDDYRGERNFKSPETSLGPTQVIANKIHEELDAPIRVSYDGAALLYEPGEPEVLGGIEEGTQFTKGKIEGAANVELNIASFVSKVTFDNNPTELVRNLIDTTRSKTSDNKPTNDLFIYKQAPDATETKNAQILTGAGNDYLYGSDGNDTLTAGEDNDYLNGGEGNDLLRGDEFTGGTGIDTAEFSDEFKNYDIETTGTTFKTTTITHKNNGIDGVDTLKNIEWGIFNGETVDLGTLRLAALAPTPAPTPAPRIIPLPLEDGEEDTESKQTVDTTANPNPNDLPTPPHVSLTAPVAMLDGDVDYTLNISPYKPDTQYNISYIFDTSASMDAVELQQAKNAYTDLTNYFIDNELAENINFGVVQFSRNAIPYFNLTADQAISTIQSLTTAPASEGTKYNDALYQGFNFLTQSPKDARNTTNIAYFVSDGRSQTNFSDPNDTSYVYDAQTLRRFSNVQAFGIDDGTNSAGGVTQSQLNFVDSNNGVIVGDASNLSAELNKSGLAGNVDHVDILVDGQVVETVQPNQLTDSPLGLTYEGSVEDLDVSIDAENIVTAEVVYTPASNLATTDVDFTVTAGEGKLTDSNGNPIDESANTSGDEDPFARIRNGGDGNDNIALGYVDQGASAGDGGDYIVGNKRDNILDGGAGNDTIYGHGGDDTITTGAGRDKIDGGEGIDTVVYDDMNYQGNNSIFLRQAGNTVSYNSTDSLTNVEFIQFDDVRISTATLEVTPVIEVEEVQVREGSTATFNFKLDMPAPVDVQFDYSTEDIDAVAGSDYVAKSGQVTILAGSTTATVDVETIDDTVYNEPTETFALNLSGLSGSTFSDNKTEFGLVAYLENKDEALVLNGGTDDDVLTGGNSNDSLRGFNGNDYLVGNEGNDTLKGDNDNDIINAGAGEDLLLGGAGDDNLDGGSQNDTLIESIDHNLSLSDTQLIGNGTDTISNIELAKLYGGAGNNSINAKNAASLETFIKGNGGNDTLQGGQINDTIQGGDGNDLLIGNAGDDNLDGGTGDDTLIESIDSDMILSNTQLIGNGTDTISNIELAKLYGKSGNNLIDATGATNIEAIIKGGDGNDTLRGGAKNDNLQGDNGDDILFGRAGDDVLNGGAGIDRLYVALDSNITLTNTQVTGDGTDTFSSVEFANLYGGGGNNLIDATSATSLKTIIKGNSGNDTLIGGAKNDNIEGGDGNDLLIGGSGVNSLSGNGGADIFVLKSTEGRDVIFGFSDGVDLLNLAGSTSFSDLNIFSNAAGTAVIIRDTSNDNQLLAIINDVRAADITELDFTDT